MGDVGFHAKAKHRILDSYFYIVSQAIKGKKRNLTFVDLFSGDGECKAIVGKEHQSPQLQEWEGPPILYLNKMKDEDINFRGFFNDLDPENKKKLKNLINDKFEYQDASVNGKFIYSSENANNVVDKIIPELKATDLNLIYLDPFNHKDLSWDTIEKFIRIEKREHYRGKNFIRRPEMIINLMTYSMNRTFRQNPEEITKALGTNIWKKFIDEIEKRNPAGKNKSMGYEKAFHNAFVKNIKNYYNEDGIFSWKITNLKARGMSYYIFFLTNHPLSIGIFKKDLHKRMQKYKENA